jgi:hypothetical protein
MLRVSFNGPTVAADATALSRLQSTFRTTHCVLLPQFIAPDLLAWIQAEIRRARLVDRRHGEDGTLASELVLPDGTCLGLLAFLANDPRVLSFVESVTGCAPLTGFFGRVYSRVPGTHFDSWHDDLVPWRQIGMSINFSTGVYEGGEFEIRECGHERMAGRLANIGFGDAILFRISEALEHRVAPLTGRVHKTAYAGWFGNKIDYNDTLRQDPSLSE